MTAFIIVVLCLQTINMGARLFYLCTDCYPRTENRYAWEDVLGTMLSIGFAVWAVVLLYTR